MGIGQRNNDRFVLHPRAIASLGRKFKKIGKIKDISLGGLAFEYIAGESGQTDVCEVDIFFSGNLFQLYYIPCEIVYEIEVHSPHVDNKYSQTLKTKRCGLAFRNLGADETTKLKLFLQAYSDGMA